MSEGVPKGIVRRVVNKGKSFRQFKDVKTFLKLRPYPRYFLRGNTADMPAVTDRRLNLLQNGDPTALRRAGPSQSDKPLGKKDNQNSRLKNRLEYFRNLF